MAERKRKGKLRQILGWATGDRHVEAEGRVVAAGGDPHDPAQVQEAEREVRRDEGDISPDAPV